MPRQNIPQRPSFALRVLQISDFHLFSQVDEELLGVKTFFALQGVVEYLLDKEEPFDLIVASGDISQDGSAESYKYAKSLIEQLGAPTIYLPGNHDNWANMCEVLSAQMQSVVNLGNWQIVALDSHLPGKNEGYLQEKQLQLVAQTAAQSENVLLMLHHNPVPMGSAWLDPMMIANGVQLLDLCESYDSIRGLAWGHVHQEMDSVWALGIKRRLLRLLACPATCLQFAPRSQQFELDTLPPGYRVIELYADGAINSWVTRVPGLNIEPQLDSHGY